MRHRFATWWKSCFSIEQPVKVLKMHLLSWSITAIVNLWIWHTKETSTLKDNKKPQLSVTPRHISTKQLNKSSIDKVTKSSSIALWLPSVWLDLFQIMSNIYLCQLSINSWSKTTSHVYLFHLWRSSHGSERTTKVRWRNSKTKSGRLYKSMRHKKFQRLKLKYG